jgi:hemerythrin-like domain-containing protein
MHQAIETLMHEHRVIEQVLGALTATAEEIRSGGDVSRERIGELADFFSGFADRCHHGKEEKELFARMVERGFPGDGGPIGVMLAEHEHGREHVRALATIGRGEGPLSAAERESFVTHAMAFAPFMAQHIAKEDQILYPMALQALGTADLDDLVKRYAVFEADVMGKGEHERLHGVADRILASAPVGTSPAATPVCHSCHG